MALPRRADLAIFQGDDWAAEVTVLNRDGTPADLTDYTAAAQIRTGPADQAQSVVADLLCAVITNSNLISISLTALQTTGMRRSLYRWDLQITSPAGEITTVLAGQVTVQLEVTRLTSPVTPLEEIVEELEYEWERPVYEP